MLNRLVYFSERACDDAAIGGFMGEAARRNRSRNITGLLMTDERSFIQILEGPRGAVSSLFQEISRDPRHHGIVLVEMTEIAAPSYPLWGMAHVSDPERIDDAWRRVMRHRSEPWPLTAFQLRGLLKIAMGGAVTAPALSVA